MQQRDIYTKTEPIVVEVISDMACPWCYIGKRRMEKALQLLPRADVQLRWRAFDLNPSTPKEGVSWDTFMVKRFGSLEFARRLEAHVASVAAEEGLEFHFDKIQRLSNTFDAHRLILLAGREGKQADVVERLYHAYFVDGQDIGVQQVLAEIATAAELDAHTVRAFLDKDAGRAEVVAEFNTSRRRGIQSVPSFFMNNKPLASGAHNPEFLAAAARAALQKCEGGFCR